MEWDTIGRENLKAAQHAKAGEFWRTSVSRAYYAAFDALNHVLLACEAPPERYRTHRHQDLDGLVRRHLTGFSVAGNRSLRVTMRRLQYARLAADYDERLTHDQAVALAAIRDAFTIFHALEVNDG